MHKGSVHGTDPCGGCLYPMGRMAVKRAQNGGNREFRRILEGLYIIRKGFISKIMQAAFKVNLYCA